MSWFNDHQWEVWLGAALLLAVTEMFSLDLILLMLAGGAVAGMATSFLTGSLAIQVLVAVIVSVGMLAMLRPELLKKMHTGPDLVLGHRQLVGRQARVTETITSQQPGRIMIEGESWQARPYDETLTINTGETVDIFEIKGATAFVHPVPRLEA